MSREGDNPTVTQEDFLAGAKLQLRGRLRMKDFHRRVVPTHGIDKLVVDDQLMKSLKDIVLYEKAR